MLRRFSTIFALSFLLVAFMAMTAFATQSPVKNRIAGKISSKTMYYSHPDDSYTETSTSSVSVGKTSYTNNVATVSPGVIIGDTWYDYQQNGTMGRMIDWGNSATTGAAFIHSIWMALPTEAIVDRHYAYRLYNAGNGALGSIVNPQNPTDFGGYCQIASTAKGAAILGGHKNPLNLDIYRSHFYYNFSPGSLFWGESIVDDSVASYGTVPQMTDQQVIWPKFSYQEGTDTVTHVFAQVSPPTGGTNQEGVYYFRKVGAKEVGVWDYPPYVVDTQNVLAQAVVGSKTSDKVALGWLARLPIEGDCDTCSENTDVSLLWEQSDNDVYYQTSDDQGQTWNPRVNVTKYQWGVVGYRAYSELSLLLDSNDDLHVVWPARPWQATFEELTIVKACRLFHYSENVPVIRTTANSDWEAEDLIECSSGKFELNMSKVQVSECDGKIYVLFVQYNDFPNGVYDDCHARISDPTEYQGAANGELYVTISSDGGTTWDVPRNLTNSRTPGCEPGETGDCESDAWPSMTRFGRANVPADDWSGAVEVDPSGGTQNLNDMWLDVQYLSDRDPGGWAAGAAPVEGTQQLSNMQWFRLACVDPIPSAQISLAPSSVAIPTWTKPSIELAVPLTVENSGNVALTFSTSIDEDNGSGWLAVSGLSGSVPSGLSNVETGTLHLNNAGAQTTEAVLTGRVVFTSNAPQTVNLEVSLIVADTLVATQFDTLFAHLTLSVASDGSYGNFKNRLGLDYVNNGVDCDTFATSYLGEGSPVILKIVGSDTLIGAGVFNGWLEDDGLKPMANGLTEPAEGSSAGLSAPYNWYSSGTVVNPDSSVAFDQKWYAPTGGTENYMVKVLKVWSHQGTALSGIRIGDVVDWDIPSDSGSDNLSGIDPLVSRNLIYMVGTEFDTDDTSGNSDCVNSDTRFGGMAFLQSLSINVTNDTTLVSEIPYSAYTARNDSFVYKANKLVAGETWANMDNSGFTVESNYTDQHMAMCYNPSLSLGATDTIYYVTAYATVYSGTATDLANAIDAAKAFAIGEELIEGSLGCCVGTRGNVDFDSEDLIDISDLVYLVDFMFTGGPAPLCLDEANVDGSGDDVIDISDLVYLVDFMFTGGPIPPSCP